MSTKPGEQPDLSPCISVRTFAHIPAQQFVFVELVLKLHFRELQSAKECNRRENGAICRTGGRSHKLSWEWMKKNVSLDGTVSKYLHMRPA